MQSGQSTQNKATCCVAIVTCDMELKLVFIVLVACVAAASDDRHCINYRRAGV